VCHKDTPRTLPEVAAHPPKQAERPSTCVERLAEPRSADFLFAGSPPLAAAMQLPDVYQVVVPFFPWDVFAGPSRGGGLQFVLQCAGPARGITGATFHGFAVGSPEPRSVCDSVWRNPCVMVWKVKGSERTGVKAGAWAIWYNLKPASHQDRKVFAGWKGEPSPPPLGALVSCSCKVLFSAGPCERTPASPKIKRFAGRSSERFLYPPDLLPSSPSLRGGGGGEHGGWL
jgi:hypothetical protein